MGPSEPAILRSAAGEAPFVVGRFSPGAAVAGSVRHLWSVEWQLPPGEDFEQEVLSDPVVHLVVEGRKIEVYGAVTARFSRRLTGAGRVLGVHFRPGGFSALSRVPMAQLTNRSTDAVEVLGLWARDLAAVAEAGSSAEAAALAERLLAPHLCSPSKEAQVVEDAVALVAADRSLIRVRDLASSLDTTVKTLQRRFHRHLGVTPKWVLRRQRIYDALDRLQSGEPVDWSALALELGFADQPHLTHAFHQLIGVTPAAYERRVAAALEAR